MRYQFTLDITVEGRAWRAGDVADAAAIPAGSLASLVRLGQVVPAPAEPLRAVPPAAELRTVPPAPTVPTPPATPQPPAPKGKHAAKK